MLDLILRLLHHLAVNLFHGISSMATTILIIRQSGLHLVDTQMTSYYIESQQLIGVMRPSGKFDPVYLAPVVLYVLGLLLLVLFHPF
jgi:hypothetical protein